ncbi:MAG: 5-formyltetrahydrofolate cyclo-ligase [Sphingomonas adhaesiva]|uniref:5-formyltetrahydrofolate cyclo-ligase n=1 Tax=Sphingomonas adhaesiva TaxID=28212 RepID=UPI002FFB6F19
MSDKNALRAALRARRDGFAATASAAIRVDPAFAMLLTPGMVVASYVPVGGEADPTPLEQVALATGCRLALPQVIDRATPLRFALHDAAAALVPGPFGLRQPPAAAPEAVPDVVLTPLVGFDRALHRIGQGAGHYDRAFAAFPAAHRIGIAWSVQETDPLQPDPWDIPLHAIATEREWIVRA